MQEAKVERKRGDGTRIKEQCARGSFDVQKCGEGPNHVACATAGLGLATESTCLMLDLVRASHMTHSFKDGRVELLFILHV